MDEDFGSLICSRLGAGFPAENRARSELHRVVNLILPCTVACARVKPHHTPPAHASERLVSFIGGCDMSEPERPEPASGDGGADRATCRGTWNVHPASPRTPIVDTLMSQTNESRFLLF